MEMSESFIKDLIQLAARLDDKGIDNCELKLHVKGAGILKVKMQFEVMEVCNE